MLGRNLILNGATINIAGTGTVGGAATNQATLTSTGATTIAGRVLGGDILVTAGGISVTGAVGDGTTTEAELRAINALDVAGAVLGRNLILNGATINVPGSGTVGGAATSQATLTSTGATTIGGRLLGSDILVTAGGINVTGMVGDAATTEAELRAANAVDVAGTLLGRTIVVDGATVNVTGTGTVGGAATNQANLTAAGTATVAGRVLGRGIRIASADIDVQASGSVGDGATQLAVLQVAGAGAGGAAQPAVLGGTSQGPGYTLTNAEAGRIRAGTLRILAPAIGTAANRDPDLFVRDLALDGNGGVGTLEIVTPGIARVEGALLMSNAAASGGVSFTAQQRLEVVTPAGGIRVRDGGGAPGGTMTLTSDNLWVASPVILALLRTDPNYAGRDDDLIDNGGIETSARLRRGGRSDAGHQRHAVRAEQRRHHGQPGRRHRLCGNHRRPRRAHHPNDRRRAGDGQRLRPPPQRRRQLHDGDSFFFQIDFQTTRGGLAQGYTAFSEFNNCIIVTGQCPGRLPPVTGAGGPDPITGPTGGSDSILLPPGARG